MANMVAGRKERLTKKRAELQASVVIAYLSEVRERIFCNDGLDSRFNGG